MNALPDLNWAGFYLMNRDSLVLGPFQGNPACIRIPLCAGVCGAAALQNKVQRVDDVHQFPGHIACDSASNAEIVIPIHKNGKLVGVLDLDSPLKNRFSEEDEWKKSRSLRIKLHFSLPNRSSYAIISKSIA